MHRASASSWQFSAKTETSNKVPPPPGFVPLHCRSATTQGRRGSLRGQKKRNDFPVLTPPPRAWRQADEAPCCRNARHCRGSHPKQLPRLNRDWSAASNWRSDARSGGGGALSAGSLPRLRIANSKPQPPDLASRCSRSGFNDCPEAPLDGGGTGRSRRGLGEATYNGRVRDTRFVEGAGEAPPSRRRRDRAVPSRPRRGHLQRSRLAVGGIRVVGLAGHTLRAIENSKEPENSSRNARPQVT